MRAQWNGMEIAKEKLRSQAIEGKLFVTITSTLARHVGNAWINELSEHSPLIDALQ
jgi:hypothetical protein